MNNNRSRAFAVLIAVFLIGVMLGMGGSYFWLKPPESVARSSEGRTPPSPNNLFLPNNPPPKPPDFNLTAEQEEQLRPIWRETREKMRALEHQQREEGDKKMEQIWNENDRKVREVLDKEQQEIFDVYVEELRKWRERPSKRRGLDPPKENRKLPKESRKQPERL